MIQTAKWDYGVATADLWDDGGISVMRTAGLLIERTAPQIIGNCSLQLARWGSVGLVAQYQHADLQISPEDLFADAIGSARPVGGAAMPVALVVKREDLEMWRVYALLMARNGVLRGLFTDDAQALRWTRRQAAIFSADRLRRTPASGR